MRTMDHLPMSSSNEAPGPRHQPHEHAVVGGVLSSDRDASSLLKALAHPVRVGIVRLLADGPHCVHELVGELGLDQPLVSQHLRIMRSAALLSTERHGREVVYSLADTHVAHIVLDAITHTQEDDGHSAESAD